MIIWKTNFADARVVARRHPSPFVHCPSTLSLLHRGVARRNSRRRRTERVASSQSRRQSDDQPAFLFFLSSCLVRSTLVLPSRFLPIRQQSRFGSANVDIKTDELPRASRVVVSFSLLPNSAFLLSTNSEISILAINRRSPRSP